jgi:hypothetical protein
MTKAARHSTLLAMSRTWRRVAIPTAFGGLAETE